MTSIPRRARDGACSFGGPRTISTPIRNEPKPRRAALKPGPAATEITSSRSPRPGPRAAESAAVSSAIPKAPLRYQELSAGGPMLGNVYRGVGQRSWEEVTDPVITDDADAIVRVSATSICGTD